RQENIGGVRNRGLEGSVNVTVLQVRDARWDLGVDGFVNSNKILSLGPDVQPFGSGANLNVVGYPVNAIWAPAILSYHDTDGNGIITANEVTVGTDKAYIGPAEPTRELTFTSGLELFSGRMRLNVLVNHRGDWIQQGLEESNRCSIMACRAVNDKAAPFDQQ